MRRPAASSDWPLGAIVACAGMATMSGGALGESSPFEATQDALFGGSLVLFQPLRGAGYRTNVDALLLAWFAATPAPVSPSRTRARRRFARCTPPATTAFDLGAGVGAVGLALLRFGAARRVVFVEIDEQPAAMARRNLDANGWADRGEVVRGDVRDVARSRRGEASLVVCNPPYTAPGRGQVRPAEALARCGELAGFVHAARQVAGKRARVCFVYRAQELGALLANLADEGLHAKRMRFVHGTREAPGARRARRSAGRPRRAASSSCRRSSSATRTGTRREMETLLAARATGVSRLVDRAPQRRSRAMAHADRTLRWLYPLGRGADRLEQRVGLRRRRSGARPQPVPNTRSTAFPSPSRRARARRRRASARARAPPWPRPRPRARPPSASTAASSDVDDPQHAERLAAVGDAPAARAVRPVIADAGDELALRGDGVRDEVVGAPVASARSARGRARRGWSRPS